MREYTIELEIYQGRGGQPRADGTHPDLVKEGICAWMYGSYEVGHRFRYPEGLGLLCPWLVDSLTGFLRALENGGTLPWKYSGTSYQKAIDPDGVTTEFVRCPDPTASGIVVKITRTAMLR
ncbi:MAG: hypothetical protein NTX23_09085 [Candidatus Bipolaricaulota bacterium]|nr:hypothetical protein [Candidatus Bipolaricaulota bacterium]